MAVDLHIHSTFSDGTLTPEQLVQSAHRLNIRAIAITDHDTVEGVERARAEGEKWGVQVITGVEFSVIHGKRHFHLLGYCFDLQNSALQNKLALIQGGRAERNKKILTKLADLGIAVSEEELYTKSKVGQTGRPHIAQLLVDKKKVVSIDAAFEKYLRIGRPAYASRYILKATEAIHLIREAGGVPVIAHPGSTDRTLRVIPDLLDDLVPEGLQGIEVFYPTHSTSQLKKLLVIATHYNLVVTGGSDYHGDIRPGSMCGEGSPLAVPDSVVEDLCSCQQKNTNQLLFNNEKR